MGKEEKRKFIGHKTKFTGVTLAFTVYAVVNETRCTNAVKRSMNIPTIGGVATVVRSIVTFVDICRFGLQEKEGKLMSV